MSGWTKIYQIPHVVFETKRQFSFRPCITLQCHRRSIFRTFLAETLYDFYKRSSPQCKVSDFWLLSWKFTKFVFWQAIFPESMSSFSYIKSMNEICLMIPKSGAKFEEKLIFYFKNDKNLVKFDLSTKKSKKLALLLVPFVQSIQRLT